MNSFRLLFLASLAVGVGLGFAQDSPAKPDAAKPEAPAKLDVAGLLEGKLVGLVDGAITEIELTGDPEYFVLYSSASY